MKRYRVIGKKRAVWFFLGAAVYFLVLVLGVGNLVASLLPDRRAPGGEWEGKAHLPVVCICGSLPSGLSLPDGGPEHIGQL